MRRLWEFCRRRLRRLLGRERAWRPGEWGERQAEAALRREGLRIVGRRVRVGRRDEIDLVAIEADTMVFVEVKTRASEAFGRPVSSVGRAKRRHLSRAAVRYLARRRNRPPPAFIRFDVVEVVGIPGTPRPIVRHLRNVFPLEGGYRFPE